MNKPKFGKRLAVSCLAICLSFVTLFCISAAAANCAETIHIEQTFSSSPDSTSASTCQYELTPIDSAFPMPEGTEDGKYIVTLVRNEGADVTIPFTHAGNYEYSLALQEMARRSRYSYDDSDYTILIQVQNIEDGGLSSAAYISKDGDKVEDIQYRHRYSPPEPDPTPSPTPSPVPDPEPTPKPTTPSNGNNSQSRDPMNTLQITRPTIKTESSKAAPEESTPISTPENPNVIDEGKTPLGDGEELIDGPPSQDPAEHGTPTFHFCIWLILFLIALAAMLAFMILWMKGRNKDEESS